jgi:hypothetical protein
MGYTVYASDGIAVKWFFHMTSYLCTPSYKYDLLPVCSSYNYLLLCPTAFILPLS